METVRLPKGTIVRLSGFPCVLAEDSYVFNSTIAGLELKAFLQTTEGGRVVAEDALTPKDLRSLVDLLEMSGLMTRR